MRIIRWYTMSLEKNVAIRTDSVDNLIDYLTNDLYC
jgi:hypothetical protein